MKRFWFTGILFRLQFFIFAYGAALVLCVSYEFVSAIVTHELSLNSSSTIIGTAFCSQLKCLSCFMEFAEWTACWHILYV